MKQSDTIRQFSDNDTKNDGINQVYVSQEIDENVRLLKEYYTKIRHFEKLRKSHFFYLNTKKNWTKSDIANRYNITRERVGQIIQSVKKGGGK